MVNIYEHNETDFNHRGTPLKNFLKCEITEALNGVYELNFEYPLESDDSHLLENGKILQVDNYDGKQLFRILYLQKDLDTIKGYALHISYDLLGNFIEDIYLQGMNGTRALQEVLNRSTDAHHFVGVSDITKLRNSRLVRKNTLEAIMGDKDNSLLSRWGGELYRDNFRINWLEKIGSDKGVTIKYAKNLTGIEYKIDLSHLVTHFIPKGFDGLLLPEKYVISPLAEKYKPIVKRKLLELEDVKSKKVSPTQEDAVDHEQALTLLREKSKKAFELGADKPEITCTVAFIDLSQTEEYKYYAVLEKIYLGDTVGVQYKGINVLTRCVGYTYDCLQNRYIHVELGNTPQQNLLANAINNQQALITKIEEVERSNVEKAKEAIKDSLNDGLGSNIKYYTDRILIMDTNDEATAKVVWKFNSNGLSVSTTGVNGNFRLATTKDGKFFAEIITGLKINSEMIETGAIDFKHLSSTVFSKVREGLITESKLSEFLITNEGLQQKLTEEVQRQIETKKPELKGKDGVNSYIHKKYSNNANGQPMSDNSNSKYIGIYTGASKTPPTNASEYSWTKIAEDNELINETIKKFKTFESTLDRFESKLSKVNRKGFKMGYTITNICSDGNIEKRGSAPQYKLKKPIIGYKYYYVLATLTDVPLDQAAGILGSNPSSIKPIYNGINLWRMRFTYNINNFYLYPLGDTTKVKSVEVYEVPDIEPARDNILSYFDEQRAKRGELSVSARGELTKGDIYTLEFAINSNVPKNSYLISKFTGFGEVKLPLSSGVNKYTFSPTSNSGGFVVWIPENLTISNVGIFKEQIKTGYRTEYNESEIDSKITQSLSEIELSLTQRIDNANSATEDLKTSIRLMQGKIDNVVTKGEFGTILSQNAYYLRLAWNNISKYIQFENGGMSFYENGVVNQNKLTGRITDDGYQFWRDNNRIGSIGTQPLKDRPSNHGLNFNLAYSGYYMGWAYEDVVGESPKLKWYYTAKSIDSNSQFDNLNAGCDINMRGFYIKHVRFDLDNLTFKSGAVTNTFRFAVATGFSSDGSANYWYSNCYMSFKNGILISSNMPT